MQFNKLDKLEIGTVLGAFLLLALVVASPMGTDEAMDDVYVFSRLNHVRELFLILIIGFLFCKSHWLARSTLITRVILLWAIWVFITSPFWILDYTPRMYFTDTLPKILLWPLVYLFFYAAARKQSPDTTRLLVACFCALGIWCCHRFWQTTTRVNATAIMTAGKTYSQLNSIYYVLLLLPWALVLKKRVYQYAGLLTVIYFVCYSMKRTAILALGAATATYILFSVRGRMSMFSKIVAMTTSCLIVVVGAMIYFDIDMASNETLTRRFESRNLMEGSGRWELYGETYKIIQNSSPGRFIFGHGQNAVEIIAVSGSSAHNDWLEVQYDFGAVGTLLYILLHGSLIVKARKLYREKSDYAPAFAVSYLLFLGMSLTSHLIIYPTYFTFLTAFWGTVIGLTQPLSGLRSDIEAVHQTRRRINQGY